MHNGTLAFDVRQINVILSVLQIVQMCDVINFRVTGISSRQTGQRLGQDQRALFDCLG
jgi:hypothetical protein